jgi:hypothetical protein
MAVITENSVRIIIDIPDKRDFNWMKAGGLWQANMKTTNLGFSSSGSTRYVWYKVDPSTNRPMTTIPTNSVKNMMLPFPDAADNTVAIKSIFDNFYERLEAIEKIALRLKVTKSSVTIADRTELIGDTRALKYDLESFQRAMSYE